MTYSDLSQQAQAALSRGDYVSLARTAQAMLLADERPPEGHFFLSVAAQALGRNDIAIKGAEIAAARSDRPLYILNHAGLVAGLGDERAAIEALHRLNANALSAPDAQRAGGLCRQMDRPDLAIPFYEHAIDTAPAPSSETLFHLAVSYIHAGHSGDGKRMLTRLLENDPSYGRAHLRLARLNRATPSDNHISLFEEALSANMSLSDKIYIQYALAKEAEDIGAYDVAWRSLYQANKSRYATSSRLFHADAALFSACRKKLSSSSAGERAKTKDAPLFVVGMPRTGTTLMDRILSAHTGFYSIGEAETLPKIIKKMSGTSSGLVTDSETLSAASDVPEGGIAKHYMEGIAARMKPAGRPIDQLPINLFYVPEIVRAFPKGHVLIMRRAPMDTLWSNYKHMFSQNFPYYDYSYDIEHCASYIIEAHKLMAALEAVYPEQVKIVDYEALVSDFEPYVRDILKFLSAPWDKGVLRFHLQNDTVATPSSEQVRQPVNSNSVGMWKNYETHLGKALHIFKDAGLKL